MTLPERLSLRFAREDDIPLVLRFIRELADYEHMLDEVVATEELLREWMFERRTVEALLAELDGEPVGFALFFHNFSTFLGRAGIYLEDLFILPEYRGRGYGKALMKHLAHITVQRGCGRFDGSCHDWNTPSIEFYKSLGAASMDDWTVYRLTGMALNKLAE